MVLLNLFIPETYIGHCLDKPKKIFVASWPILKSTNFKRRSRSPSQTCTPSPSGRPSRVRPQFFFLSFRFWQQIQDTGTCVAVCMRDKGCLITGQEAVKRARGGNFTGLEVAHIFPLMGVCIVSTDLCHRIHSSHFFFVQDKWTKLLSPSAQNQVYSCKIEDRPHNAIRLRADIHSLFDDYQWSIWVCQFYFWL